MKRKVVLVFLMMIVLVGCSSVKEDEWTETRELISEIYNLSQEEIIENQKIALKEKYQNSNDDAVYEYKFLGNPFGADNVLLGFSNELNWAQRSSADFHQKTAFTYLEDIQNLLLEDGCSVYVDGKIIFDDSMDNQLAVFGKVQTNRFLVTKKAKNNEEILETYTEDFLVITQRTYQPIYHDVDGSLKIKMDNAFYTVKTINKIPTSIEDLIDYKL